MRLSLLKHPLAVLRTMLGLGQKEMADLVKKSPRTIQAIELGQLKLGEDLARDIAFQTGAGLGWLLRGDPSKPPIDNFRGRPYTRKVFEEQQAMLQTPMGATRNDEDHVVVALEYLLWYMGDGLLEAIMQDKLDLFHYKVGTALRDINKEFGANQRWGLRGPATQPPSPFGKKFAERMREDLEQLGTAIPRALKKLGPVPRPPFPSATNPSPSPGAELCSPQPPSGKSQTTSAHPRGPARRASGNTSESPRESSRTRRPRAARR